jgi:hypothetical protein
MAILGLVGAANRSVVLTAGNQSFLLDLNKSYNLRGGCYVSPSFLDDSMTVDKKLDKDLLETTTQLKAHML